MFKRQTPKGGKENNERSADRKLREAILGKSSKKRRGCKQSCMRSSNPTPAIRYGAGQLRQPW